MSSEQIQIGDHVRVKADCPHTLPAYARMLVGEVLGRNEDGSMKIRWGEDHEFPVAPEWLVRVDAPSE